MTEEVDSRYDTVSQEVMDAALSSGNYVKGADGVVRDYFTGTEIRVRGVDTNDTATVNDAIGADVASQQEIYQEYRDNGYSHEDALAISQGGLETVFDGTSSDSNGSKQGNKSSSGNYKTRNDRFSIEAAISEYAKDKWLYGSRKRKRKIQDGILRYPLQSLTSSTDYLQIDIGNYEPVGERYINTPGSSKRYVTSTSRGSSNSTAHLSTRPLINAGTILLPIPSQIADTNTATYGQSSINGIEAWAAGTGEDLMNLDWENADIEQTIRDMGQKAFGEVSTGIGSIEMAKTRMRKQFLGSALKIFNSDVEASQLLSRSTGEVLNPHMELLFSGPTIRNFNFAFKFTPRNELEAQQVKLIIRAFKSNMAPKVRGSAGSSMSGSWFLKTPNVFKIQYKSGNKNHPFLNKFKQCFLNSVNTSYTADGTYTTYDDGTPTSMILSLSFTETEPIYDLDYEDGPGTQGVGY